ncbi:DUF2512 family protein [Rossellomorea marisflavi]|uniref:DUF2512 family protein n=1 Tax=Rossellomorea marisflavi TaxID=189381 RepID=A0A5D4S1T5_9BACI|nr:DUF2512 family protein [Rossellomorea marisflavi]
MFLKYVSAFLLKLVVTFLILYTVLAGIQGLSMGSIIALTGVLVLIGYLLGDLYLLLRTTNGWAVLADFGLSSIVVYFLSSAMVAGSQTFLVRSFVAAVAVSSFEWFFHHHLRKNVFLPDSSAPVYRQDYQTEASEEFQPDLDRDER